MVLLLDRHNKPYTCWLYCLLLLFLYNFTHTVATKPVASVAGKHGCGSYESSGGLWMVHSLGQKGIVYYVGWIVDDQDMGSGGWHSLYLSIASTKFGVQYQILFLFWCSFCTRILLMRSPPFPCNLKYYKVNSIFKYGVKFRTSCLSFDNWWVINRQKKIYLYTCNVVLLQGCSTITYRAMKLK